MHIVGVDELRAIDGLTYLPLTSKSRLVLIVAVRVPKTTKACTLLSRWQILYGPDCL